MDRHCERFLPKTGDSRLWIFPLSSLLTAERVLNDISSMIEALISNAEQAFLSKNLDGRTALYARMYDLPTRDQLLIKLNETDEFAEREMERYIDASLTIIEYIDNLYVSRNISLD